MSAGVITVRVDDRVRALATLLALTTWPEQEQAYKPHGIHAHAKAVRAALGHLENHPAAIKMQEMLESGLTLDDVFSYVNALSWPGMRAKAADLPAWAPEDWSGELRDFVNANRVRDVWEHDRTAWVQAEDQARAALATGGDPADLLGRFFGAQSLDFTFQPNLCYPTAETIGFRSDKGLTCICPPPVAWGNNPPWPYDDNPPETYREAFSTYARILLREFFAAQPDAADVVRRSKLPVPNTFLARYPDWFDQFSVLLVSGLTALALRQSYNEQEEAAYILMSHKAHGFQILPAVVDVLRHYLAERETGKYADFAAYLPAFFASLKVAERIKKG
jgi:hypothetical protein